MLECLLLPGTDLQVSRLCLGTANIGVKTTEGEAMGLFDRYCELGGNFIDTARVYSDWIPGESGRSERIIGDWLRRNPGMRDRLVLATKGGHYEWSDKSLNRVTLECVRRDIERSLTALGVDTIDLYYLHRDSLTLSVEEIVDFMQAFVEEGKVRYLGVANWKTERIAAANEYASATGKHGFVANQPLFSLGAWNVEAGKDATMVTLDKAGYDYHRESGLSLVPYSSQSQGFFSKALGEVAFDRDAFVSSRFYNERNLALAETVRTIANERACNANAISLGYLACQPFPVFPLVGCNTIEQLEDSVRGVELTLSTQELQMLENAAESGVTHSV